MTRKILKPKILGVLIAAIAVGIFFGVPSIPMTVSAAGAVPDWFRGVAGFWADEQITKRLKSALELLDIRVLDHIIVGDELVSFAERGLL